MIGIFFSVIGTEKNMAAQDFSKALGGKTGTRNGHDYDIGHAAEFPYLLLPMCP